MQEPALEHPALDELVTLRDILRFAVSRFNAAKLIYGHGTANAVDEAAFMVLEGLSLPIDDVNPWADARITRAERAKLLELIEARIATRKPAPYLLGKAYVGGLGFKVDERVIIPRSYLAELLTNGTLGPDGLGLIDDPSTVSSVLDLCTGSGCLAIIAALAFPEAHVDAVDLSADALAVASANVETYELTERVRLRAGDLFGPLRQRRYDLIITNPPYVARAEVDAFPPEYAAEPMLAHLGGEDGLDLVRRILAEAPDYLTDQGALLCEIGTGRHLIEDEFPDLNFTWLDSENSDGEVFWISAEELGLG
ncbi:MAG: 50S ribosomal protein L3 N(5)-glutamine methyltransferase [Alphaproteobacteria bacterium]